jgi:Beta-lactamase enzyme family
VRSRVVLAAGSGLVLVAAGAIVVSLTGHGTNAPKPAASTRSARPAGSAVATGSPAAARSARPAESAHADPFGSAATSYVTARAGAVLAAVYDIKTGQTWRLGTGPPQAEASVVKLDVLETLLAEQRQSSPAGLSAGDRSLAREMIEDSDNDAATSLWYQVGGATKIRSFNALVGLTSTSPSPCVVCAGFPWPGWGLTTTVPTDQLALLRELVTPGTLLTSTERSYALSLMENVTPSQRWGVSGGVPVQVTVALKNGWLPLNAADTDWQVNSVGWISGSGRSYLMAVLTTGNPTEQYGIDTIDQLSAVVWNNMN